MSSHKRRTVLKSVGGVAIVGTLAGCAGSDDAPDGPNGTDGAQNGSDDGDEPAEGNETDDDEEMESETEARLRVAHLSPDAPNVDVLVDGDAVLEDVPYRTVSDYLELAAGSYDVQITAAGDAETVVFDETVELSDGATTAAALGELAEENQPFAVELFEDDLSDPGEDARVRLVHAAPDAPNVTVTAGDEPLFEDVGFGEASTVTVAPDAYELEVRPADDTDGEPVATFDLEPEAGVVYSAFAVGYLEPADAPADESFDLEVVVDAE